MKDPAFLFYYQDWLVGTYFLTRREKGAYMDLLCYQADKGMLTLETIKDILNSDFDCWDKLKEKFIEEEGIFYNKRLKIEKQKRIEYAESHRKRIQNYWDKKNIQVNNKCNTPVEHGLYLSSSSSIKEEYKETSLHSKCKEFFIQWYKEHKEIDYYWTAKDAGQLKQMIKKLNARALIKSLPTNDEGIVKLLKSLLDYIKENSTKTEHWIWENLSIANLNSQFQQIIERGSKKR